MWLQAATGRHFLAELRHCDSRTRLLVLLEHSNGERLRNALAVHADAYVSLESSRIELVDAIRAVVAGQRYLCQQASRRLLREQLSHQHPAALEEAPITPRQREIIALIAVGQSNKRIALSINRSVKTVEKHRSDLMTRLGLHNAAEITRFAMQSGIVTGGVNA
jgi:DNA-binding NarL/FixJ family response regulator